MAVGSGRVTVIGNTAACTGQKIFPIPRERDNTSDLEDEALRVRQKWAHIRTGKDSPDSEFAVGGQDWDGVSTGGPRSVPASGRGTRSGSSGSGGGGTPGTGGTNGDTNGDTNGG